MPAPGFAAMLAKPIVVPGTASVADASGSKGIRVSALYPAFRKHNPSHHDGHAGIGVHVHDWERMVVVWRRENGEWRRNSLHMSYHAGYIYLPWNEIQNTFKYSDIGEQAGKDKDAAKIYAGWSKHANFDTRNTRWNDPSSQRCIREPRSWDWHYMADEANLAAAGADTEVEWLWEI